MSERGVWVMRNGELIPKHLAPPPLVARSDLSAPMLIRDGMEPTWNPVNGKQYDSKRKFEKAVRDAGCVIVGNEKAKPPPPQRVCTEADVANAIAQVESRQTTQRRKKRVRS